MRVGGAPDPGHHQRREPHRRPRRPGRRLRHLRLRRLHGDRLLGLPPPRRSTASTTPSTSPSSPPPCSGPAPGFLWWNAAPAQIFMGDTGSLAIGAGAGRPGPDAPTRPAAAHHRRPVRDRDDVGDHPGRQLPALRPAGLPHGADPPPLRARRLARDDGDRPVLDHRRALHRRRRSASSTPTSSASRGARRCSTPPDSRSPPWCLGLGVTGQAVVRALVAHGRRRCSSSTTIRADAGRRCADERSAWS